MTTVEAELLRRVCQPCDEDTDDEINEYEDAVDPDCELDEIDLSM